MFGVHTYNVIHSAVKMEGYSGLKQHGQPQKCSAKWKKAGTKGDTLYDSICMTLYRRLSSRDRNKISSCQELEGRGRVLATEEQEGTNFWV